MKKNIKDTSQATHEEICEGALKDYERISKETCDWNSVIPKAIEFYKNKDKLFSLQKQEIVEEIEKIIKKQYMEGNFNVKTVKYIEAGYNLARSEFIKELNQKLTK